MHIENSGENVVIERLPIIKWLYKTKIELNLNKEQVGIRTDLIKRGHVDKHMKIDGAYHFLMKKKIIFTFV